MDSISREDVLDTASALWRKRTSLTLDQIDGAFYWGVCRGADFFAPFAGREAGEGFSLKHLKDIARDYPDWLKGDWFDEPSGMVIPELRPAWARVWPGPTRYKDNIPSETAAGWLIVGIRSGYWSGDDVAKHVASWMSANPESVEKISPYPMPPGDQTSIYIRAALHAPNSFEISLPRAIDPEIGPPIFLDFWSVVLWIKAPLPPPSLIGAFYDDVVVQQHRWNDRLEGAMNGQDVAVAIRTWAFSLLKSAGLRDHLAWFEVERALPEVVIPAPSKVARDIDRLVARVPEALPFLNPSKGGRGGNPSPP